MQIIVDKPPQPHAPRAYRAFSPALLKMIKQPGVIKHLRKASNTKEKKNNWGRKALRGHRLCSMKMSKKNLQKSVTTTNQEYRRKDIWSIDTWKDVQCP